MIALLAGLAVADGPADCSLGLTYDGGSYLCLPRSGCPADLAPLDYFAADLLVQASLDSAEYAAAAHRYLMALRCQRDIDDEAQADALAWVALIAWRDEARDLELVDACLRGARFAALREPKWSPPWASSFPASHPIWSYGRVLPNRGQPGCYLPDGNGADVHTATTLAFPLTRSETSHDPHPNHERRRTLQRP